MSGYDKELYKVHDEYMMIDTAIMDNKAKFPKSGIVRVAAVPRPLREILDYAMEQRKEVLDIAGRALTGSDNVYLINQHHKEPAVKQPETDAQMDGIPETQEQAHGRKRAGANSSYTLP